MDAPAPIKVELFDHDERWAEMVQYLSDVLLALGCFEAVHHIGSTAVPGLIAKPIIDLLPVVADLQLIDAKQKQIESFGYTWHGELGISGRRYRKLENEQGKRLAQLHIFAAGSPQVIRHLAFRDYLRAHPTVAAEYALEKKRARDLHPDSSHAYSHAKAPWILAREEEALNWWRTVQGRGN